jgi:hypothetical protein
MCGKKGIVAGLAAGLVITVLAQAIDLLVQFVFPYDVLAMGGMRAVTDPIMMAFFLHGWVLAFAMVVVYSKLGGALKGGFIEKGKKFGFLMWLVVSLPSIFLVYTSMNYPIGFHVSNVIASIVYMLAAGITITKLMK